MKIKIGIASSRRHELYESFIKGKDPINTVRLSYELNNLEEALSCDGIILAGGEDVHPIFYGDPELIESYGLTDVDEKRDEFEWDLLKLIEENGMPLFGICRGLQLANVYFGGNLIPDLVRSGKKDHTRISETEDRQHNIKISKNSFLYELAGETGKVNSAHHQAINKIAPGFRISAVSEDGVIEAIEREQEEDHPFIQLVQWHPERMDLKNPLSGNLRTRFLDTL